ncbi:MAG TPA: O-antigen translocase [Ginsengibacter sp.]
MSQHKDSYKQIFKATSIFGGVQVFNVLIAIIRSKVVAIILGPSGMGIVGLLNSTIGLITSLTNFGLGTSAVKNVAAAGGSGDQEKLGKTVAVFKRLVWLTGGLGFIITLVLAPWLSKIAFGNKFYTVSFMLVSVTLLITQITAGQNVILQGMRRIQLLAKASVLGALSGLLISIPLYYFFKEKGIVPAIILTSISALLVSFFYANKIKISKTIVEKATFRAESKDMLKMGFLISMASLITMGSSYILRVFISNKNGLIDVGLFTAGFAIVGTYAGMVFTAMGTDYYPRLSTVAHDNLKCKQEVNQQAEIAILILAPILTILLVFVQWGVVLLYSKEFVGVVDMIHWATFGIFFQALSWSLAYLLLAKSASKTFFWNDLVANIYMLGLNMAGYYYFGLVGLGISFLFAYFFYFIQMFIVCKKLYDFSLDKDTIRIFIIQFLIATACFICIRLLSVIFAYVTGTALIVLSCTYSWKELNKRILLKQMILNRIRR